jgi:Na+/H+-translocating membrane pyrophosphatase
MGPETRAITDTLDALGNITAAFGKGFTIGSAALTALALFAAYTETAGIDAIDLMNSRVVIGLFLGGIVPRLIAALTMKAVGRAAFGMVQEVRSQFREVKGSWRDKRLRRRGIPRGREVWRGRVSGAAWTGRYWRGRGASSSTIVVYS